MKMNKVGLKHQIIGESGTITYQYPYATMEVPYGSTVYLYTEGTTGQTTTVPDAVGKTGSFASQMLHASNLNVRIVGDENAQVVSQDVDAGQSVEYGTVVTLTTAAQESAEPQPETTAEPAPQEE